MDTRDLTRRVKAKAVELGFTLVGVTSPDPPPHLDVFHQWLSAGRHGEMGYLAGERSLERRADPRKILPECKSILVLSIPYDKPAVPQGAGTGRVAAYASGRDYHEALKPRLSKIVDTLEELVGGPVPNRWYTDSGPLLERELAQRAGLGWIGKNTMLINPRRGSYSLLAEILLGIDLEFDTPETTDYCGSCRRCIDACPTHCILEDRTLDTTRCISYLTIELKGAIPLELRSQIGNWVFGCDICQIACPWNQRFAEQKGDPAFSGSHSPVMLPDTLHLSDAEFNRQFKSSPIKRTKRRGFLRNLIVALGNSRPAKSVGMLVKVLREEPEPLVRGHAVWALSQMGGRMADETLQRAANEENDPGVLAEIRAALGN